MSARRKVSGSKRGSVSSITPSPFHRDYCRLQKVQEVQKGGGLNPSCTLCTFCTGFWGKQQIVDVPTVPCSASRWGCLLAEPSGVLELLQNCLSFLRSDRLTKRLAAYLLKRNNPLVAFVRAYPFQNAACQCNFAPNMSGLLTQPVLECGIVIFKRHEFACHFHQVAKPAISNTPSHLDTAPAPWRGAGCQS